MIAGTVVGLAIGIVVSDVFLPDGLDSLWRIVIRRLRNRAAAYRHRRAHQKKGTTS